MSVGLGVDIVEIERMRRILDRTPSFAHKVFTDVEQDYCNRKGNPATHYAARFAAKEAVCKALGTGILASGIGMRDVEVVRDSHGKPAIALHGAAARIAEEQGVVDVPLSITYTHSVAVANAVAITKASQAEREKRRDVKAELAQQFNRMVLSLRRNQQALLENQQALNDAQIRMLQAQLNPHFLCNTLDTMKWISKINQVPQVALMSTNLADILRFCILPDEFVPLEKELQILGRYVEIQRIRLSDSFTYEQTVPEALLSCMVPKMMLQPLAENAILHGLSGVPDGKLTVEARELEDETLEIRVCDNGAGLPEALLGPYRPPEKQTRHLGLFNVDTILKKHYGERFGLRLDNRTDGTGACITARLPVRRRDAE